MNRRSLLVLALTAALAAALAAFLAPRPHHLGDAGTGDAALAQRVRDAAGDVPGHRGLQVALVEGGRTATATVGARGGGPLFEIGSLAKPLTAMLFADLVADGVVRPGDTLAATLPQVAFEDPRTGAVTLEELATHRSGLPRLATGNPVVSGLRTLAGRNPYEGQDVGAVLAAAAAARTGDDRGRVVYSNFGMTLLGQALAARTGIPYPELLADRVLRPLGMTATVVAGPPPPGADATTPRFDAGDGGRIGWAWFTDTHGGREITWHNGATGGFSAYLAIDRAAGRAVVVLGDTDRGVENLGLRLLGVTGAPDPAPHRPFAVAVTLLALLAGAGTTAAAALAPARPGPWWRPAADRLRVLTAALSAAVWLAGVWRFGAWLAVPPWLWVVAAGLAAGGAAVAVLRWRSLPADATGRPGARWAAVAVSAVVDAAALAVLAWMW
ncbi:serine hydrolase domain-containing protein [Spirilliplanes yamanashiensis]|uniref:Beta-lactamase n=1 Tax=Spirilliplanes yamanashiensis TaxID=42233 RepID=A0A8J4DHZ0_9ACTN|nr:serine hydrolase domain-containing protein [Spirilliplanes yamanashiensis]MDP9819665.1 CubicO group peptidase (beta-lactamase class C family) [Spirilliplanes yamanashiensis]GIJ01515.1 hypothetical protein Sya03_08670 [Spirilliplanes yamanashiensis]